MANTGRRSTFGNVFPPRYGFRSTFHLRFPILAGPSAVPHAVQAPHLAARPRPGPQVRLDSAPRLQRSCGRQRDGGGLSSAGVRERSAGAGGPGGLARSSPTSPRGEAVWVMAGGTKPGAPGGTARSSRPRPRDGSRPNLPSACRVLRALSSLWEKQSQAQFPLKASKPGRTGPSEATPPGSPEAQAAVSTARARRSLVLAQTPPRPRPAHNAAPRSPAQARHGSASSLRTAHKLLGRAGRERRGGVGLGLTRNEINGTAATASGTCRSRRAWWWRR